MTQLLVQPEARSGDIRETWETYIPVRSLYGSAMLYYVLLYTENTV